LLEKGSIMADGKPLEVAEIYRNFWAPELAAVP
jgi:hypothetical protein